MLARELEWVRSSVKARQAKSKARLQRSDEMVAEAQREARDPALEIMIAPGRGWATRSWCSRACPRRTAIGC